MGNRLVWITLLALFSALFLVGCGTEQDTASDTSSSSLVDPTQLLTKQEAEEILGEPVKKPRSTVVPLVNKFYSMNLSMKPIPCDTCSYRSIKPLLCPRL